MNIYDFADEEHRLTHEAEETHRDYFINAAGVTLVLSNLVGIPLTDCETFFRFYAQAKKHHTLSVLSTVRHLSYPLIFLRAKMQPQVGASLRRFSCDES